eukprot:2894617-Amphidinium_carterae.1
MSGSSVGWHASLASELVEHTRAGNTLSDTAKERQLCTNSQKPVAHAPSSLQYSKGLSVYITSKFAVQCGVLPETAKRLCVVLGNIPTWLSSESSLVRDWLGFHRVGRAEVSSYSARSWRSQALDEVGLSSCILDD